MMQENISVYGIPLFERAPFLFPISTDIDYDDDGLPNDYEVTMLMDPFDPSNAWEDHDSDGWTTKSEYELETDPFGS